MIHFYITFAANLCAFKSQSCLQIFQFRYFNSTKPPVDLILWWTENKTDWELILDAMVSESTSKASIHAIQTNCHLHHSPERQMGSRKGSSCIKMSLFLNQPLPSWGGEREEIAQQEQHSTRLFIHLLAIIAGRWSEIYVNYTVKGVCLNSCLQRYGFDYAKERIGQVVFKNAGC